MKEWADGISETMRKWLSKEASETGFLFTLIWMSFSCSRPFLPVHSVILSSLLGLNMSSDTQVLFWSLFYVWIWYFLICLSRPQGPVRCLFLNFILYSLFSTLARLYTTVFLILLKCKCLIDAYFLIKTILWVLVEYVGNWDARFTEFIKVLP